jgi:hypothetical protein
VLVPTCEFVQKLQAARLAADVADTPTVLIARTDALGAYLLTSDVDERDRPFCTGEMGGRSGWGGVVDFNWQHVGRDLWQADCQRRCCTLFSLDLGSYMYHNTTHVP